VLGINQDAVTIKQVEVEIIDNAFDRGWVVPLPPDRLTNKKVAVVGSGPAGLAAAQQLTRAGHQVTVFERADRIGGLLRYGIPEFKMEKRHIDRRIEQMEAEGTQFRTGVNVGVDLTAAQLRLNYDAVVLTGGATDWRDLPIPGRELDGIHQAMEYLPWANRVQNGDPVLGDDGEPPITAKGKKVADDALTQMTRTTVLAASRISLSRKERKLMIDLCERILMDIEEDMRAGEEDEAA